MISHLPWATYFVKNVMNPGGRGAAVDDLSEKMLGQRLKNGSMTKDLFYHLVRHRKRVWSLFSLT